MSRMHDDTNEWDVSLFSHDEFIEFFFNERNGGVGRAPLLGEVQFPERVVAHMTRLFLGFENIAINRSMPQINQGIWAMWGPDFELYNTLWNPSVDLSRRLECIRSMYEVYANFVAKSQVQVMENCFDMWWDSICCSFWSHVHYTKKIEEGDVDKLSHEERKLLDCMFETLTRILRLNDPRTQSFALHGLGHLHHPDVKRLVQGFIDQSRQEFTPEGLAWLEKCRDGTVM
jgi:hypothetical protein